MIESGESAEGGESVAFDTTTLRRYAEARATKNGAASRKICVSRTKGQRHNCSHAGTPHPAWSAALLPHAPSLVPSLRPRAPVLSVSDNSAPRIAVDRAPLPKPAPSMRVGSTCRQLRAASEASANFFTKGSLAVRARLKKTVRALARRDSPRHKTARPSRAASCAGRAPLTLS